MEFLQYMRSELALAAILLVILIRKIYRDTGDAGTWLKLINILLFLNCVLGFFCNTEGSLFADMFRTDPLIALEKNILNLGTFLISLQSYHWLKGHKHIPEFYMLMLSTLLGMFFMISAQNLLMFYLGLELSSIPLAALANFDLEKKRSSEAALKFIISSAFSSGFLLFGISLLYGLCGTLNYAGIAQHLNTGPLMIFALVLIIGGFGFKMSAVPFHLWTADVYEGSPVPVASFLSVVSKGAIVFVFLTILYQVLAPLSAIWHYLIPLVSAMTILTGNLFALRQQNIKRFLAFSSIAQIGFILVGISGYRDTGSASVVYFILIYVFSNLGAFGVVNLVSALSGKESIDDYKGFHKTNPALAWVLTLALFSLAGIPPTAGFTGKFFLLMSGANGGYFPLVIFAALNMVISLYYYLRIVRVMFMDVNENPLQRMRPSFFPALALGICVAGILVTGLAGGCYNAIFNMLQ